MSYFIMLFNSRPFLRSAKQWNGPFHGDGSWVVKKRPN